jgi:hypothetical protein
MQVNKIGVRHEPNLTPSADDGQAKCRWPEQVGQTRSGMDRRGVKSKNSFSREKAQRAQRDNAAIKTKMERPEGKSGQCLAAELLAGE